MQTQKHMSSTFTPFLGEVGRLQMLKNVYHDSMRDLDFGLRDDRSSLIDTSECMYSEIVNRIGTSDDWRDLQRSIDSMKNFDANLEVQWNNRSLVSMFREEGYLFLQYVNRVFQSSGLGLKMTGSTSELDTLAHALQADTFYPNAAGIMINYNMDVLARYWNSRVKKKLDNFWGIEAPEGFGKSTYAMEIASTQMGQNGLKFDLTHNMFQSEKREYVYEVLRTKAQRGDVFIFDEAVNQASKKAWWKTDQVELMRQFTLMRYLGVTALFCVPEIADLDIVLRNRRLQGVISIAERGNATVKLPNLNPDAPSYSLDKYAKNEVVTSPEALAEFLGAFDKNKILTHPFWAIPETHPLWVQYYTLKDASFRSRKMEKLAKKSSNAGAVKERMIAALVGALDPSVATLNAKQVDSFGVRAGYKLSFDSMARYIAKNTGLTTTDIVKVADPLNSKDLNKDSYIDLNEPHVHSFLERLRNQTVSDKEAEK